MIVTSRDLFVVADTEEACRSMSTMDAVLTANDALPLNDFFQGGLEVFIFVKGRMASRAVGQPALRPVSRIFHAVLGEISHSHQKEILSKEKE